MTEHADLHLDIGRSGRLPIGWRGQRKTQWHASGSAIPSQAGGDGSIGLRAVRGGTCLRRWGPIVVLRTSRIRAITATSLSRSLDQVESYVQVTAARVSGRQAGAQHMVTLLDIIERNAHGEPKQVVSAHARGIAHHPLILQSQQIFLAALPLRGLAEPTKPAGQFGKRDAPPTPFATPSSSRLGHALPLPFPTWPPNGGVLSLPPSIPHAAALVIHL